MGALIKQRVDSLSVMNIIEHRLDSFEEPSLDKKCPFLEKCHVQILLAEPGSVSKVVVAAVVIVAVVVVVDLSFFNLKDFSKLLVVYVYYRSQLNDAESFCLAFRRSMTDGF